MLVGGQHGADVLFWPRRGEVVHLDAADRSAAAQDRWRDHRGIAGDRVHEGEHRRAVVGDHELQPRHVAADARIPVRLLGRVGLQGAHQPVGHVPGEPVRRGADADALAQHLLDHLVAVRLSAVGIDEDVGELARGAHDVVALRPVVLDQTKLRLLPGEPVPGNRVAQVPRAAGPLVGAARAVPELEQAVVLQHAAPADGERLPRMLGAQHRAGQLDRRVDGQLDVVSGVDEAVVDEELLAVGDVQHRSIVEHLAQGCGTSVTTSPASGSERSWSGAPAASLRNSMRMPPPRAAA